MNMPFADPAAPSSGIEWTPLNGSLLIIRVHSLETGIPTAYGEADAVRADVSVVDGQQAGEQFANTLIFPKILVSQLSAQQGQTVLGRLGQGSPKPGQSPPWMLVAATDADRQQAQQFLAQSTVNGAAQPAPAAQQQPQPQGQPQQQVQPQGQQVHGQPQQQGGQVPF